MPNVSSPGNTRGSFTSILKEGNSKQVSSDQLTHALVLNDSCIKDRDFSMSLMGQVKEKSCNHIRVGSWFSSIKSTCNSFVSDKRIVWVSVEGITNNSWTNNTFSNIASKWGELVEREESEENSLSCIHLCLKTKIDEIINESQLMLMRGAKWDKEYENINDDNDVDRVSESSCMQGNVFVHEKVTNIHSEETPLSNDPFNIYELLNKKKDNVSKSKASDLTYPPGFTPEFENNNIDEGVIPACEQVKTTLSKNHSTSRNVDVLSQRTASSHIAGGFIIDVMDDLIKIGQTMGYNMEGYFKKIADIIGAQGDRIYYGYMDSVIYKTSYHLCVRSSRVIREKGAMGIDFSLINRWDGETVILGDFNEVRMKQERFGSNFNIQGANAFNNFISLTSLIGFPLGGHSFTWAHKSATKMSKLDRFLISQAKLGVQNKLKKVDKAIDQGRGNVDILNQHTMLMKDLNDFISIDVSELSQKTKVCWSIEGDEKSKYFHGIINSKRSQVAIRWILKDDLISDGQTAFVSNRQILNGSFILNGLLSWCNLKKVNTMIFKVDFKKDFDFVRWDYLDDVLKSFGFGDNWRSWISGCLRRAKESMLINGSPTSEFQFHKSLKQDDPFTPFLFILLMESLHLSFKRVLEAGLFNGISINNSLMIS
ncbi:RNA-directed DNA polymerase, eukaryota [Tanacetum coccineum]